VFLRSYATYLLGEARKEEERLEAGGLLGSSQALNKVPFRLTNDLGMYSLELGYPLHCADNSGINEHQKLHATQMLSRVDSHRTVHISSQSLCMSWRNPLVQQDVCMQRCRL